MLLWCRRLVCGEHDSGRSRTRRAVAMLQAHRGRLHLARMHLRHHLLPGSGHHQISQVRWQIISFSFTCSNPPAKDAYRCISREAELVGAHVRWRVTCRRWNTHQVTGRNANDKKWKSFESFTSTYIISQCHPSTFILVSCSKKYSTPRAARKHHRLLRKYQIGQLSHTLLSFILFAFALHFVEKAIIRSPSRILLPPRHPSRGSLETWVAHMNYSLGAN